MINATIGVIFVIFSGSVTGRAGRQMPYITSSNFQHGNRQRPGAVLTEDP